jgi:hypothetical protein
MHFTPHPIAVSRRGSLPTRYIPLYTVLRMPQPSRTGMMGQLGTRLVAHRDEGGAHEWQTARQKSEQPCIRSQR